MLGIRHPRAKIDCAGGGVYRNVREVERARLIVWRAVGQQDLHRGLVLLRERDVAGLLSLAQRDQVGGADCEVHVDRIDLLDGGEQCSDRASVGGAVADDRACRHLLLPGDAGDRRAHLRIAEIHARAIDRGLVRLYFRCRATFDCVGIVDRLLRYGTDRQ